MMRILLILVAAMLIAAGDPAWAWRDTLPGAEGWPAIPEPGGIAWFQGSWSPLCNNGTWHEHRTMTLHADGRITYIKKKPYLATQYRVIETTPYYVVTLTRRISKHYGEILRFVILQVETYEPYLAWNECRPDERDMAGFSWADDDAALTRVWRESRSCNPTFKKPYDGSPFFGLQFWSQSCNFIRDTSVAK
jgi:hypothetical protein